MERYLTKCNNKISIILRQNPIHKYKQRNHITQRTIHNLKKKHNIVIKPTDKNLGIAAIDKSTYIQEGYNKLNSDNYIKITQPIPYIKIVKELIDILIDVNLLQPSEPIENINYSLPMNWKQFENNEHFSDLTKLLTFYLSNPKLIKVCRFYIIPKIHKNPIQWREICASPMWITYIASLYIDLCLQPLLQQIPSYVKNSSQIVCELDDMQLPPNCVLLQADVQSMYPSIDTTDGLNALQRILTKNNFHNEYKNLLLKLTKWVLTNNYMTFNNETFLQKNGTAMGTPLSVVYACLYLADLEEKTINNMLYYRLEDPLYYRRLVDDLCGIFSSENTAQLFLNIFHSNAPNNINFDFEISLQTTNFLDITIYKSCKFITTGKLSTKLYQKPMNKYLFLPFISQHQTSVFTSWIKDYITRICILCSELIIYKENLKTFKARLLERGYTNSFLNKIFKKLPNRRLLLQNLKQRIDINLNPIHTFNTAIILPLDDRTKNLKRQIRNALQFTNEFKEEDIHFKQLFSKTTTAPMIAFKNGRNLQQHLVKSKL